MDSLSGEEDETLETIQATKIMLERLDDRMPGLQAALEKSLEQRMKSMKIIVGLVAAGVVICIGLGIWLFSVVQEVEQNRRDAAQIACTFANEGRAANRQAIENILHAAAASRDVEITEERFNAITAPLESLNPIPCEELL